MKALNIRLIVKRESTGSYSVRMKVVDQPEEIKGTGRVFSLGKNEIKSVFYPTLHVEFSFDYRGEINDIKLVTLYIRGNDSRHNNNINTAYVYSLKHLEKLLDIIYELVAKYNKSIGYEYFVPEIIFENDIYARD